MLNRTRKWVSLYLKKRKETNSRALATVKTAGLAKAPAGPLENSKVFVRLAKKGKRSTDYFQYKNQTIGEITETIPYIC